MTLPHERLRSIRYAREFLLSLVQPKETPRVPRSVRDQACRILRHYPFDYEVELLAQGNATHFIDKLDRLEPSKLPFAD